MLTAKEKDHYFKYTMHHGARWLASVMKARECTDPQVVSDYYLEAMMQVFRKLYEDRTKGLSQEVEISQWDLINAIREIGGIQSGPRPYYSDEFDAVAYELDSKSKKYSFCLEIRYDEKVQCVWYALKGTPCFWPIAKLYLSTEQFVYLIKEFVEYMDELALVSYKALEKAKKLLLLEDIEKITEQSILK